MKTEYTITVQPSMHDDGTYIATLDNYDGLVDGNNEYGMGDTHYEAIYDLIGTGVIPDDEMVIDD